MCAGPNGWLRKGRENQAQGAPGAKEGPKVGKSAWSIGVGGWKTTDVIGYKVRW